MLLLQLLRLLRFDGQDDGSPAPSHRRPRHGAALLAIARPKARAACHPLATLPAAPPSEAAASPATAVAAGSAGAAGSPSSRPAAEGDDEAAGLRRFGPLARRPSSSTATATLLPPGTGAREAPVLEPPPLLERLGGPAAAAAAATAAVPLLSSSSWPSARWLNSTSSALFSPAPASPQSAAAQVATVSLLPPSTADGELGTASKSAQLDHGPLFSSAEARRSRRRCMRIGRK